MAMLTMTMPNDDDNNGSGDDDGDDSWCWRLYSSDDHDDQDVQWTECLCV